MKSSILQVSKKDDQRENEDHQETYFNHILFFHSFSFITLPFLSFFPLLSFSLQGDCVSYRIPWKSTRSPENLQDAPVGITVA